MGFSLPAEWLQPEPQAAEDFEVLRDYWDAVTLFLRCDTEWNMNHMSGQLLSLNRSGLVAVGRLMFDDPARLLEVLDDVRIIEAAVVINQPKPKTHGG